MRRPLAFSVELIIISLLVLVTRCANYGDVFFGGQIYFVDADCYARMTRARVCFEHPGTIVRRHEFENFPSGTSPHTTALLDYVIVATANLLRPFTNNALDLGGAIVSPLLSVALGVLLCWWSRKMRIRFRWGLLVLYAGSPILAHGFALGRPDHQSLLIALVTIALCAEWSLVYSREVGVAGEQKHRVPDMRSGVAPATSLKAWSIVSGASWALALWVSFYEPLILLLILMVFRLRSFFSRQRGMGWIVFAVILGTGFLVERRIPHWPSPAFGAALKNWSGTIGELSHVSLGNPIWFGWCGWLLLLAPILFWRRRDTIIPAFLIALLVATFALTIWQARWAYFFVIIFALALPEILSLVRRPMIAVLIFATGLFPIAQSWDRRFEEQNLAQEAENRMEQIELRAIASHLDGPFLAPWWFSPALSYWSRQAGVGGSSHESIRGIVETAKFFATENAQELTELVRRLNVSWIVVYDPERVAHNSSQILGRVVSKNASCYFLDYRALEAPRVLQLTAQTGHFKLFRVSQS